MIKKHIYTFAIIIITFAIINSQNIYDSILQYSGDIESLYFTSSTTFEVLVIDGENKSDIVQINNKEQTQSLINLLNSLNLLKKDSQILNANHSEYAYIYINDENIDTIGIAGNYLTIWLKGSDDSVFTRYYILNSDYNFLTDNNKIYRYLEGLAF